MADDRSRLEKFLGMLGSEFDGERANAAAMIAKLAQKEGKTIAELVMVGRTTTVYVDRYVERWREGPPPGRKILDELDEAARLFSDHLSEWEEEFIASVSTQCWGDRDMSDRQMEIAKTIRHRLEKRIRNSLV